MPAASALPIDGYVEAGFEPVLDVFRRNFAERGELGAAVTVIAGGATVVNLRGGWADSARRQPWTPRTLTNVWSATKGMTAICALLLAERGALDIDAPVSSYWPEFAQAGKADIPVRWLLSHRSGVTGVGPGRIVEYRDLLDWPLMVDLLAAQEPLFEPGSVSGYQAISYGYLVGEVIRRISGQSVGRFFAGNVAGPLNADVRIGLNAADMERCSTMAEPVQDPASAAAASPAPTPAMLAAFANPQPLGRFANEPGWRAAEIPAANGHATAEGLATVYAALADGSGRILSPETIEAGRDSQGLCVDVVAGVSNEFGLGFTLGSQQRSFGPNPRAFGHDGFGGSTGFADPENGIGFGYVMNQMGAGLRDDPRKMALVDATYACLSSRPR